MLAAAFSWSNEALISTLPVLSALTTPRSFTVAIAVFEDDHVTTASSATVFKRPPGMPTLSVSATVSPSSSARTPSMISALGVEGTGEGGVVEFEHPADMTTTSRYAADQRRARIFHLTAVATTIQLHPPGTYTMWRGGPHDGIRCVSNLPRVRVPRSCRCSACGVRRRFSFETDAHCRDRESAH